MNVVVFLPPSDFNGRGVNRSGSLDLHLLLMPLEMQPFGICHDGVYTRHT